MSVEIVILTIGRVLIIFELSLLGRGPKFCLGSINLLRFSKFRRGGPRMMIAYF